MNHIGLFEGIGGFSLAARWMNWNTIAWCEINPFCQKVLSYHFPKANKHEDICKTDFTIYRGECDIITGGFPCQPFSHAGNRKGSEDERFLWKEMLRAIQEIKPKYIIAENVFGLTNIDGGLVFEQVCIDLENEGYEVQAFVIPACSKNAPHKRERIWIIAYSISSTDCRNKRSIQAETIETNTGGKEQGSSSQQQLQLPSFTSSIFGNSSDSNSNRLQGSISANINQQQQSKENTSQECLYSYRGGISFKGFPTKSAICGGDDGIPSQLDNITVSKWKTESITAYGNAIVPDVAYELFKIIEQLNQKP